MSEQSSPGPAGGQLFATRRVGGERYILIKQLGRGGMGVVWLAHDERLDENVALKFLPQEINSDSAALEDLRRETLRSRKLTHPNIIRIHDLYEARGEAAFISMEFVEGLNLIDLRIHRGERVLRWTELKPLLEQLCEALDYAHGEKVVHRDLKPANMMLDANGRLKLADFGIAATISDATSRVSLRHASSGTLAYMSPQQLDGETPKVADDIYALGATIYELLTSRPPFFSGDVPYQVRHLPPKPMEERLAEFQIQNEILPDVAALVMACLAKEPSHRPASARAVAEWIGFELDSSTTLKGKSLFNEQQLSPAEATVDSSSIEPPVHAGTGKKLAWVLGMLLVLLAVGAGIFLANRKPSSKNPDRPAPPEIASGAQKDTVSTVDSPSSPPPTNGLILYFNFDEEPQNGIVQDQSGYGNNGKAAGAQWIPDGIRGGALLLSPSDSSIRVADNDSLNPAQFSMCAWIKTSRADHFFRRIFDKGLFHNGFSLSISGDFGKRNPPSRYRGFVEFQSARNPELMSIHSVTNGKWHFVAATFDGRENRLFIDGQLQFTARCSNISLKNNLDLVIGGFTDPALNFDDPHASFDGALDEVMIFNRALSPAEIWNLYESIRVPTVENPQSMTQASPQPSLQNGLVLYFNFDEEPQNGIVRDQSGNGNDGHVVGAQWTPDGKRGGGMVFSPDNCHIIVTNNDSLNPEQITLAAWIKTARGDHFWRRIIDKSWRSGFALSVNGDFAKGNPPTSRRGYVSMEVGRRAVDTDRSLADGQWHHVAATYDGAKLCVYADGQPLCREVQRKGFVEKNKFDLLIGGFTDRDESADDPNASFDGTLDEVMIFNRALSPAEVWTLYDSMGAPAAASQSRIETKPQPDLDSSNSSSKSLQYGLYLHFDLSTFTGYDRNAPGFGTFSPQRFAPTGIDVRDWARTARQAGMTFAVLTVKHEAGFCLWNAQDYDYSISQSPVKVDILGDFISACSLEGILPGAHYSIPDAHNEGRARFDGPVGQIYFDLIKKQIADLHSKYPGLRIQIFDVSSRLSQQQWDELIGVVHKFNPQCVVLDRTHQPLQLSDTINRGWIWSSSSQIKPAQQLLASYETAMTDGKSFLLNVGVDASGRIPDADKAVLMEMKNLTVH